MSHRIGARAPAKRKPKFETETFTAPACWASYLINGDASGIDDEDQAAADAFQREMNERGYNWPVDCSEESEFMWNPDYGEAGDCLTYTFLKQVD